jgi:NADH-quinone oxidoreductase subunit N
MFTTDLAIAAPQLILAVGCLALLVLGAFLARPDRVVGRGHGRPGCRNLRGRLGPQGTRLPGALSADAASVFAKVVIYLSSLVAIPLGTAGSPGGAGCSNSRCSSSWPPSAWG